MWIHVTLLAESPSDLQAGLNALQEYCSKWALSVNDNKTKVMVFVDAGLPNAFVWSYSGFPLQQVSFYHYLGVILSNTGSFTTGVKT